MQVAYLCPLPCCFSSAITKLMAWQQPRAAWGKSPAAAAAAACSDRLFSRFQSMFQCPSVAAWRRSRRISLSRAEKAASGAQGVAV